MLAKGARPIWVKDGATISKVLALEVIHTLLSNNTKLFEYSDEFGELLKQFVCPLVVEVLGDAEHHYNFPVYVRTMNVLRSLIVNHYKFLRIEMESLFASLLLMLSDDFISPAQAGTVAILGTLKGEVVKDTGPKADTDTTQRVDKDLLDTILPASVSDVVPSTDSSDNGSSLRRRRGSSTSSDTSIENTATLQSKPPSWRHALALEVLMSITMDTNIMHYVYKHYDCVENAANLYSITLSRLSYFIASSIDGVFSHLLKNDETYLVTPKTAKAEGEKS